MLFAFPKAERQVAIELAGHMLDHATDATRAGGRDAIAWTGACKASVTDTAVFIAQLAGALVVPFSGLLLSAAAAFVLNAGLLWIGVVVFDREAILTRWR